MHWKLLVQKLVHSFQIIGFRSPWIASSLFWYGCFDSTFSLIQDSTSAGIFQDSLQSVFNKSQRISNGFLYFAAMSAIISLPNHRILYFSIVFQLKCSRDEYYSSNSGKMTLAFKLVFVILLELCLFVEYDLGKITVS